MVQACSALSLEVRSQEVEWLPRAGSLQQADTGTGQPSLARWTKGMI